EHRGAKAEQLERECALRGLCERDGRLCRCSRDAGFLRLAKNRMDSRVRILKVRPGPALGREHPVPIEDVVLDPIVREVRVLDRADADLRSERAAGGRIERRIPLRRLGVGPLGRLGEQRRERDGVARARLQHLLVGAENRAERDMLRARRGLQPAGELAGREYHCEMLRLRRADDIEQPRAVQRLRSVTKSGEIRRGVAVTAVLLANDQRQRLALAVREARHEDAERAIVDRRDSALLELRRNLRQHRVVEAFAAQVLVAEQHAESVVVVAEVLLRNVDQLAPERKRVRVSGLEQHDAAAGALRELGILIELHARVTVERAELADAGIRAALFALAEIDEMLDQHPERRAPIADVVLAYDLVAEYL